MPNVTVTLGNHTFTVAPAARKYMSLNYATIEIPDGTDIIHVMGVQNKEIVLTAEELSDTAIADLENAYRTEAELTLNIPNFEENAKVRVADVSYSEVAGVAEKTYYDVQITLVKAEGST